MSVALQPVLLVEDDAEIRTAMRCLLELDGYPVVTASNGAQALDQLRAGLRPGLILLDLMTPVMDGFQFRREQMEDATLAAIPVAVYSGHYDPKASAARLGAAAYFEKPVEIETLLSVVATYCLKRS